MIAFALWRAYAVAVLGTAVMWTLANPALRGWRALAIAGLGWLLWFFSVAEAFIAVWDASRKAFEAEHEYPFRPIDPGPEITRNLLQVDTAKWVYEDILNREDMRRLAMGLLDGRPFSYREWEKQIPSIRRVQDEFERRGLVYIVGKKRKLNGRGRRAMLEYIYQDHPLPPPLPQA